MLLSFYSAKSTRSRKHRRLGRFEQLEDRRLLATFQVTNVNDSGAGSLRQAILDSNFATGRDAIHFDIATSDKTIRPITQLPTVADAVDIDATTQPGFEGHPLVELSGELLTGTESGLALQAGGNSVRGLVINDFPVAGIFIFGSGQNVIASNYLGTDITGQLAGERQRNGIFVAAPTNVIGGDTPNARNVISGNTEDGLRFSGAGTENNRVIGNYIGTNYDGTEAIPNLLDGILLDVDVANNYVGTDGDGVNDDVEGNLVSGNGRNGIRIYGAELNHVAGNTIGISASGEILGNTQNGVLIDNASRNNWIGVDGDGLGDSNERNVISGNGWNGVWISGAHHNHVSGNLIGLSTDGQRAMGNAGRGVLVSLAASNNLIGTNDDGLSDATERNVISGNAEQGIYLLENGTAANIVAGNYIGTDETGTTAVPNTFTGVLLAQGARDNIIGVSDNSSTGSLAGNVISGNSDYGLLFWDSGTVENLAAGNIIGLDASGTNSIPNLLGGVSSRGGATDNRIGGGRPQDANFISGNQGHGIFIQASSGSNQIQGNYVGFANDQITALGNSKSGVAIDAASDNTIGNGTATGKNFIAHNGESGVVITGESQRNSISYNSIYAHSLTDIDLGGDGATANDALDADAGPNSRQNYPVIQLAAFDAGMLHLAGTFESVPNTEYRLEFYSDNNGLPASEAREFLGFLLVTTNRDGLVTWLTELPFQQGTTQTVSATAHGAPTGTSEFSLPQGIDATLILSAGQTVATEGETIGVSLNRNGHQVGQELTLALSSSDSKQIILPDSITIPASQDSINFEVKIIDDPFAEEDMLLNIFATTDGIGGVLPISISDSDLGWHNLALGLDVSGNGIVSAFDVLLVINAINTGISSVAGLAPVTPRVYLDVNNDAVVSGLDTLLIINFLNSDIGEGEPSESTENASFTTTLPSFATAWLALDTFESQKKRYSSLR